MNIDYIYSVAWIVNCGFWFWVGYTVRPKSSGGIVE